MSEAPPLILVAGLLLPAFVILLILLRHASLALLLAMAPLPALAVEEALGLAAPYVYVFGFCTGLLAGGMLLRGLLYGNANWRGAATMISGAAAGAAATAAPSDWKAALALALSGALAVGLAVAGVRWMSFGEAFIARANRAAETRALALDVAAQIAAPRWALALSGVGVVMAALAWFEVAPHSGPDYPGFVVVAVAAFLLSRDWRAAAAAALCAALLWLFGAENALPFFALPALLLCAAARGEKGGESWRRTLEEEGAGLLFAALGGVILLAELHEAVAGSVAFVTALILFPALTAALWSVFPRRRSVEEMYGG